MNKIIEELFKGEFTQDKLFKDAVIQQAQNTALEMVVLQSILVMKGICKQEEFDQVRKALKPKFDEMFDATLNDIKKEYEEKSK